MAAVTQPDPSLVLLRAPLQFKMIIFESLSLCSLLEISVSRRQPASTPALAQEQAAWFLSGFQTHRRKRRCSHRLLAWGYAQSLETAYAETAYPSGAPRPFCEVYLQQIASKTQGRARCRERSGQSSPHLRLASHNRGGCQTLQARGYLRIFSPTKPPWLTGERELWPLGWRQPGRSPDRSRHPARQHPLLPQQEDCSPPCNYFPTFVW